MWLYGLGQALVFEGPCSYMLELCGKEPKGSTYCPFKDSGSKSYTWYSLWNQSP